MDLLTPWCNSTGTICGVCNVHGLRSKQNSGRKTRAHCSCEAIYGRRDGWVEFWQHSLWSAGKKSRPPPSSSVLAVSYSHNCTGLDYKVIPRLRECCRQVEAEVVSNSSNKIHQTWEGPYSRALYIPRRKLSSEPDPSMVLRKMLPQLIYEHWSRGGIQLEAAMQLGHSLLRGPNFW